MNNIINKLSLKQTLTNHNPQNTVGTATEKNIMIK